MKFITLDSDLSPKTEIPQFVKYFGTECWIAEIFTHSISAQYGWTSPQNNFQSPHINAHNY